MCKVIVILLLIPALAGCGTTDGSEEEGPPRTIVFSAQNDDEGTFQIFSMREDGSGVKQLTDGEFSSTNPAWSPDGSRIAYARSTGSTAGEALWVMDADGSNKEPLVTNPRTGAPQLGNHPAWSPNGNKLAFDRCVNCAFGGKNVEIFVADLQTGAVDTLTEHPSGDGQPIWSPDDTQLLFGSNRDYFDADTLRFRNDIYSISVNEKELKRITFSEFPGSAGGYNWLSSDRISYVLFNLNTNLKDLVILEKESGEQHPVLTDLDVSQFWTFWDPTNRQFLSIEKKHNEIPVTLILFDLDGNMLEEIKLTDPVLKAAVGFKWKNTP